MSEELDRRAALAMGWTWGLVGYDSCWNKDGDFRRLGSNWSPSTDRNDLSELLREVERRGLDKVAASKNFDRWVESNSKSDAWIWLLTADPAVICEAACEVLEAR